MVRTRFKCSSRMSVLFVVASFFLLNSFLSAAEQDPWARVPWTASRIKGSPEPPLPYTVERIFPEVEFKNPVDFALEPGTGRWLILQLDGKLFLLDPKLDSAPQLIHDAHVDVPNHDRSYGIALHPDYLKNRQIYLSYIAKNDSVNGTHVSQFLVADETVRVDSQSEKLLITWPSGGHNGACLKFGPDGFLYITAGDGTGPFPPDSANVGQDLGDLRSTIMRIDVDHSGKETPYAIPSDNPFVDVADARPEVWAFGFRNPWKISFDQQTGDLWCGDVGWELWELIFKVKKSGNYGWSIKEGSQPVRNDLQQGPGEIIPPVVQHPHTEAASITGGYIYNGKKLAALSGQYLYGDYVSGKIWALRQESETKSVTAEIADTSLAIVSFGVDAAGELVVMDYAGGLYRLVPSHVPDLSAQFPRLLSETGLYSQTEDRITNEAGVYSYNINNPMWQDRANAGYEIAIPGDASIIWNNKHHLWRYPPGTVFSKTLVMWTVFDNTLAHRKIETQLLHFDGLQWNPYSYLWNNEETDAELVDSNGTVKKLTVQKDYSEDELEEIEWRVQSRSECMACHVTPAGDVLGFDLPNLKLRSLSFSDQIDKFIELKIFDKEIPENRRGVAMLRSWETGDLDVKARSYLAINCAHCHRRNGRGASPIEFSYELPLERTLTIDTQPTQGTFGIANAKIIAPGSPHRSVLYYRMATSGRGHMPHRGAAEVDPEGLQLIAEWIRSLNKETSKPTLDAEFDEQIETLLAADVSDSELQKLFDSTSQTLAVAESLDQIQDHKKRREISARLAASAPQHLRGLFERFLPRAERQKTLGTSVDTASILGMQGEASNGERFFHIAEGVTCRNCHQILDKGKSVGPDLSKIGGQRTRTEILSSILNPSLKIDSKYVTRTVVSHQGHVVSGIVIDEQADVLKLKDSAGKLHVIQKSEIEEMVNQPRSLMPDLLTKEITAQELADLLEYLNSLK